MKIHLDFETRSNLELNEVGAWKYAMHPSTEIMCMSWSSSVGDGTPGIVTSFSAPYLFTDLDFMAADQMVAHSAHFEYAIWNFILHKRYGWPALWGPERWSCTLAKAAACGLPLSLDRLSQALKLPVQKDMMGRRVMLQLCKPQGFDALGLPHYDEDPGKKQKLYEYCRTDVKMEILVDAALPDLSPAEKKIWDLDLKINLRGVTADVTAAQRARATAADITTSLNDKLYNLTGGQVSKASRIAEIKRWLSSKKAETESLDKAAVVKLLADPTIPGDVKSVVEIRQQVGKSSTAKYETILNYASSLDDRMRGMLQYHAAATGRWGGRGPQPQNFPKGVGFDSDAVCSDILALSPSAFWQKYGDKAMDALSAALRGVLTAGKGNILVVADYSAIEARVLFWEAGDELALGKYRLGMNLYVDMAKFIYSDDTIGKKTHPDEYAIGKAAILGCGYGMGAKKFKATCALPPYNVDISEERAQGAISAYRKKYKSVVEFWYKTEKAAHNAIVNPGSVHPVGNRGIIYGMDKKREFLCCKLPSGRVLRYYRPTVKPIETPWGEKQEIHYWANGIGGKLEEQKTYGGALVENITQAVARDIMANGMLNAEAAGYKVILTVHDELVTEVKESDKTKTVKGLETEMCQLPKWAAGLPIAAEGWMGFRYRK